MADETDDTDATDATDATEDEARHGSYGAESFTWVYVGLLCGPFTVG